MGLGENFSEKVFFQGQTIAGQKACKNHKAAKEQGRGTFYKKFPQVEPFSSQAVRHFQGKPKQGR